jgi:RimJ/RimL family protein N-acetyltransferase
MTLDPARIAFRRLRLDDMISIHRWLETDHVARWFSDEGKTYEAVVKRYAPKADDSYPTKGYVICIDERPIGFIQTYRIADWPQYARHVHVNEVAAGLDLFIGEPDCAHRGLGSRIIGQFVRDVVFADEAVASCIIGPDVTNRIAIRAYEKAGFRYLKTISIPGEKNPEYLMRLGRDEALCWPAASVRVPQ